MNDRPLPRGIVIVSCGGLRHGGGIGSVSRMIKAWIGAHHPAIRVTVVDPRGERGPLWSLLRVPVALLQLLYQRLVHGADVLHLQVSERMSFPRKSTFFLLGRALGMRVVLHHHGADLRGSFTSASPRMRRLMRWLVDRVDVNIALGQVWREFLVEQMHAPRERVVVHYNAAQDLEPGGGRPPDDPWKFLIAANLLPRKGIGDLLEAVALLRSEGAPASLTLAGGGQVARYREEARARGIDAACTFTGWISGTDLHRLFASHSALVLPSHLEGLPMAIIEALGARLPVVATPVGSIPEVLHDGIDCLLVPCQAPRALADALRRIATDPALRERLVRNGRQVYEQNFQVERYMARLLLLYQSLSPAPGAAARADSVG